MKFLIFIFVRADGYPDAVHRASWEKICSKQKMFYSLKHHLSPKLRDAYVHISRLNPSFEEWIISLRKRQTKAQLVPKSWQYFCLLCIQILFAKTKVKLLFKYFEQLIVIFFNLRWNRFSFLRLNSRFEVFFCRVFDFLL